MTFEWDDAKNKRNIAKHGISFFEAQAAFLDKKRVVYRDDKHSLREDRFYCIGRLENGGIATVRFTNRHGHIRIIGAGYWREGRKLYEEN